MTRLQRETLIHQVEQFVAEFRKKLEADLTDMQLELEQGNDASMPDITFKLYSNRVESLMDFRTAGDCMKVDVYILHGKGEASDLEEDHFEADNFERVLIYCMKAIGYHQSIGDA